MSFKLTIGRTAIAGRDLYTNEAIAAFHPKSDVDNEFLFYWLPHLVGTAQTDQAIKGATLNKQKLLALAGMLPPLDEQRRIAEVLRSVDETIAAAQSAADQACYVLDGHLSALMKDGAAHGEHASTGGLPDGWSEDRCDTFFILQRGFDITESQAVPGPFRVISSSGPSYSHSQSAVNGPAVITGRKGRLGTVFYSATPCWPHDTTLWVKDFKGNNPRFVYWKLREMRLDAYDAATSVPTLNRNNVHALTIRFPPLREQGEIVEILDAEEVAIAQQAAVVDALAKAKEVLANDLLSGRVRVPA